MTCEHGCFSVITFILDMTLFDTTAGFGRVHPKSLLHVLCANTSNPDIVSFTWWIDWSAMTQKWLSNNVARQLLLHRLAASVPILLTLNPKQTLTLKYRKYILAAPYFAGLHSLPVSGIDVCYTALQQAHSCCTMLCWTATSVCGWHWCEQSTEMVSGHITPVPSCDVYDTAGTVLYNNIIARSFGEQTFAAWNSRSGQ